MDQIDSIFTCNFPNVPKLSPTVKSLLEISDSMDAEIIQSKVLVSKSTNHFGPWIPDDKWSPRKQRTNRNYRKQVARLLLSKRSSSSVELPRKSFLNADDAFEISSKIESSRDAVDPYFKKRHTDTTTPGPQLKYTTSKSNTLAPDVIQTYHQTPSLPTLITLQSPANKNFHTAFSLGKVEYNDPEMTSSVGVPLLLYSKSDGLRETKSALVEKSSNLDENYQNFEKLTEFRPKTSFDDRPSDEYGAQIDGKNNKVSNTNITETIHGTVSKQLPNMNATNYVTPSINNRGNSFQDDYFDRITSPPVNPKILKIMSRRKPSPPMCEFEDISLHIRHYRMYHTVRFTGRFSLANQPAPRDVQPVQWSEVFPHRPLSVNSTTTVPVFRLNVKDLSNTTSNNQTQDADLGKTTSPPCTVCDKSKFEVHRGNGENKSETDTGDESKLSYRRRSIPSCKDRSVTIDLTPVVLKYKVKKGNNCQGEALGDLEQEEKDLNAGMGDKKKTDLEKDGEKQSKESRSNKIGHKKSSKSENKSTKKLPDLSKDVKIIGNLNTKSKEENSNTSQNDSFQDSPSTDFEGSRNVGEEERNTTKVLLSYREYIKRSSSKAYRDGIYTPRLRKGRESMLQTSSDSDWRYPYGRKHSFMSIISSDHEVTNQQLKNIIIDENQLKTSIDEKINDSNLRYDPKRRSPDEAAGDKFIKFMVNHDEAQKCHNAKQQQEEKSGMLYNNRRKLNSGDACREKDGSDVQGLGIVSTYDVNTCHSDDIIETEATSDADEGPQNHSPPVVSSDKKFWNPKNSRLSAKTRKINQSTEAMRHLMSDPFQNQTLPSVNNSAFVFTAPPTRKGFDDRSVVLPLQDFVHLAMKGNDQTFSNVSKSINNGCKLGISQNMTMRSASSRRPMDDGLVRVVSFASPVNQFIFAKRITGYSAGSGEVQVADGPFIDTEQKARSVFHGKAAGSFRLRLKDFGVRRPKTENSKDELPADNEEEKERLDASKEKTVNHTQIYNGDDENDDERSHHSDIDEMSVFEKKKFVDIYIPNGGDENESDSDLIVSNGDNDTTKKRNDFRQGGDNIKGENQSASQAPELKYLHETPYTDAPSNAQERERSALRKRIVKLAEMRTSSQASDFESTHMPNIYEGHASLSASVDIAQRMGTHGFKLIHGISGSGGNKVSSAEGQLNGYNGNTLSALSNTQGSYEFNDLKSFSNDIASLDLRDEMSAQQPRFPLRQRAKFKARKKIFKPNTIICKDVKVASIKQHASVANTSETKRPIVPEGNPMMYSKIIRGSCLKKDVAEEDEAQRPKTVRFKCDGVEYRFMDRIHDKK